MKRLILSALILPLTGLTGFNRAPLSTESIDVRTGKWPIILERAGSS
jgi:hypothetical protein